MPSPFHFAFHVVDLNMSREFYCNVVGCSEGRSTATWVDIDFFGHQLSLHLGQPFETSHTGKVGLHMVPMPHFGAILPMEKWRGVAERLRKHHVPFVLEPSVRFAGEPGEQATMFFLDPSGNPFELKGFNEMDSVFSV